MYLLSQTNLCDHRFTGYDLAMEKPRAHHSFFQACQLQLSDASGQPASSAKIGAKPCDLSHPQSTRAEEYKAEWRTHHCHESLTNTLPDHCWVHLLTRGV